MSLPDPLVVLRRGAALPAGTPRTLIVVGPARSGTTMVARMLHDLGVFMGEGLGGTWQDAAMSEILRALFDRRITVAHPAIDALLRRCDREHTVWGWKFTDHLFEPLYARARNPHLVVVFRDPLAIASRDSVSLGRAIEPCLRSALEQTAMFGRFSLSTSYPCLAISYERGLARKAELVEALAAFAGIAAAPEVRRRAIANAEPGSRDYIRDSRAPAIEGAVDKVDASVAGWLRYPHEGDRRVPFRLLVDGAAIYHGVADRFRADLKHSFGNDGCCAFDVELPDKLRDGRSHKVTIYVEEAANYFIADNDKAWIIAGP